MTKAQAIKRNTSSTLDALVEAHNDALIDALFDLPYELRQVALSEVNAVARTRKLTPQEAAIKTMLEGQAQMQHAMALIEALQ